MKLPERIFFTGVPGSRWSGIAQTLELIPGFNTSDRTSERAYAADHFTSGHKGSYFGRLMEFPADLDSKTLDQAWSEPGGCKIIKSHDWAYDLDLIKEIFPNDWIMLVYRPDQASFDWWKQAGGWSITYPNYQVYCNDDVMKKEISWQNQCILKFAERNQLEWSTFDTDWIVKQFSHTVPVEKVWPDIKVAILK